jgi:hypothetical protein
MLNPFRKFIHPATFIVFLRLVVVKIPHAHLVPKAFKYLNPQACKKEGPIIRAFGAATNAFLKVSCVIKNSVSLPTIGLRVMNLDKPKLTGLLQDGERILMISLKP